VPRPARFDPDQLLDAALALAVEHTPTGVSVAEVARRAGAPSGSVYHRFPSRVVLLGELWLRTIERFQDGFFAALTADGPVKAARFVVEWSRIHPDEARLLLHARAEFGPQEWPTDLTARAARQDRRLRAALPSAAGERERLLIAVVDLPLGVVRRHLAGGGTIPARAADDVESAAAAVLSGSRG
jgi:AcrR family transcriptional regulator